MTPTLVDVATLLCKGADPPDWVIERLGKRAKLVADATEDQGDDIDRLLLESALHLQRLLPQYITRVYEMIELPKRGPKLDHPRHLCAAVCMAIWREVWGRPQPHSPKLWEACEAYWVACGHPANPSGHIKNWEDYLLKNIDHPLIAPK
jgi:hypothetical protein